MNRIFTKIFSRTLVLVFVMNVFSLPAMAWFGQPGVGMEITVDGIKYRFQEKTATTQISPKASVVPDFELIVIANDENPYAGDMIIPAEVMWEENKTTYPVGGIDANAFQNCTGLRTVVIEAAITSIPGSAFKGCTGLVAVSIPASVTVIETEVFSGCSNLIDVYFEGVLPELSISAQLVLGQGMVYDSGSLAFNGCTNMIVYGPNITPDNLPEFWADYYADKVREVKDLNAASIGFSISGKEGNKYYGTFYSDRPVRLTAGVIGYIATGVENNVLQMDARYEGGTSNDIVPANTAIILGGNESSSGNFETLARFADAIDVEVPTDNLLYGVSVNTVIPDEADYSFYKLSYAPGSNRTKIGFYYAEEDGRGGFEAPAHKAYLKLQTVQAANVKGFAFKDAAVTGIENAEMELSEEETIYTLQGIRVERPLQQGIYIVNGKKAMVK